MHHHVSSQQLGTVGTITFLSCVDEEAEAEWVEGMALGYTPGEKSRGHCSIIPLFDFATMEDSLLFELLCSLNFHDNTRLTFLLASGHFSRVCRWTLLHLSSHKILVFLPVLWLFVFFALSSWAFNLNYCLCAAESQIPLSIPEHESENHTHEFNHLFDLSLQCAP